MNHLISIITPVYNSEKFIRETIKSVLEQSYKNWEMILIDDCSEDDSVRIIKEYLDRDKRFKLILNNEKSGPGVSRNKGIKESQGHFITFLDSDDIWFPQFLDTSISFCLDNQYEFVFSSYKRYDENLAPLINDFIVPDKVNYENVLRSCPISCLTAFIDIRRIGKLYMPTLDKRQDWGLWLSILKKVAYAYGIKDPLAIYRMRKDSISRSKLKLIPYVWKIYREVENLSFIKSLYLVNLWALNGFKKYYVGTKIKG